MTSETECTRMFVEENTYRPTTLKRSGSLDATTFHLTSRRKRYCNIFFMIILFINISAGGFLLYNSFYPSSFTLPPLTTTTTTTMMNASTAAAADNLPPFKERDANESELFNASVTALEAAAAMATTQSISDNVVQLLTRIENRQNDVYDRQSETFNGTLEALTIISQGSLDMWSNFTNEIQLASKNTNDTLARLDSRLTAVYDRLDKFDDEKNNNKLNASMESVQNNTSSNNTDYEIA